MYLECCGFVRRSNEEQSANHLEMEIKSLKGTTTNSILQAFNCAFTGYFVPIELTEPQLSAKMKADKTNLGLSVGVFEDRDLVAFILHGFEVIK